MTIEVPCSGCGRTLKVGEEHAGKMARCPVCGHITQVAGGTPAAAAEPLPAASPAPTAATWSMRTPEGQEFGPTTREELDRWIGEGRITADCMLRQGEDAWQNADALFPQLAVTRQSVSPFAAAPQASAAAPYYPHRPASPYPAPAPAPPLGPASYVTPHRGPLILVLGLLGLMLGCPILSLIAWVMGSNDLRDMEAGRMDRSGMDLTRVGMILGMILSILWILGFLLVFGLILLGVMAD